MVRKKWGEGEEESERSEERERERGVTKMGKVRGGEILYMQNLLILQLKPKL